MKFFAAGARGGCGNAFLKFFAAKTAKYFEGQGVCVSRPYAYDSVPRDRMPARCLPLALAAALMLAAGVTADRDDKMAKYYKRTGQKFLDEKAKVGVCVCWCMLCMFM